MSDSDSGMHPPAAKNVKPSTASGIPKTYPANKKDKTELVLCLFSYVDVSALITLSLQVKLTN